MARRPTGIYVFMLAMFVAGLWGILRAGSTMRAAPNLHGEWTLLDAANEPIGTVNIEQSGQHVQLSRPKFSAVRLKLTMGNGIKLKSNRRGVELLGPDATGGFSVRILGDFDLMLGVHRMTPLKADLAASNQAIQQPNARSQ